MRPKKGAEASLHEATDLLGSAALGFNQELAHENCSDATHNCEEAVHLRDTDGADNGQEELAQHEVAHPVKDHGNRNPAACMNCQT